MTILSNIANEVIVLRTLICREVKSYNKRLKEIDTGIIDLDYSVTRYLQPHTRFKYSKKHKRPRI